MAQLKQKLHHLKNGVTEEITCYTTLAEVQNQGWPMKIGGTNCYAKYGAASDSNATQLNYKPPNGGNYRILKQAKLPYGEKAYIAQGVYTFTVPAGITKVKVALCGGGGETTKESYTTKFGNYLNATSDNRTGSESSRWGYVLGFNGTKSSTGYGCGPIYTIKRNNSKKYYLCSKYSCETIKVNAGETISVVVGAAKQKAKPEELHILEYCSVSGTSGFVLIAWGGDIV